jgi:hypothetical protein
MNDFRALRLVGLAFHAGMDPIRSRWCAQ